MIIPPKAPLVIPMIESEVRDDGKGISSLNSNKLPNPRREQHNPKTITKKALKPEPIERLYKPIAKEVDKMPRPAKANKTKMMNVATIAPMIAAPIITQINNVAIVRRKISIPSSGFISFC